jgi:hypothetical protein
MVSLETCASYCFHLSLPTRPDRRKAVAKDDCRSLTLLYEMKGDSVCLYLTLLHRKGQSWPAGLPIVVEFAAVTAATDGDDRIGAANGPEHSGAFETGGDEGFATRFDHS